MSKRHFFTMLQRQWNEGKFVCVGLDSEYKRIPRCVKTIHIGDTMFSFNQLIIDATKDIAGAYKPNLAFYERYGQNGMRTLFRTIEEIKHRAPGVPIILDAKRGDIGNTNLNYVEEAFTYFDADAITIHPYLGKEAMQPFLDQTNKGIFVLCRTSNKGAGEFQDLDVVTSRSQTTRKVYTTKLYRKVADNVVTDWNTNYNCGLVVGATFPEELKAVRELVGDMPILIPGIGAQGGDIQKTVLAGRNSNNEGMIINSSSGIIFASGKKDFAEKAREKTISLNDQINEFRLM